MELTVGTDSTCYFVLIITSGAIHLIFDGSLAIGASDAVNGVIGIYLFFISAQKLVVYGQLYELGRSFPSPLKILRLID